MRTLTLVTLMGLLTACGSSSIGITDPDDTDVSDDTDVDTDDDTDVDTDDDTDPPVPEVARWYGEREFTFGDICRDELIEEGVEITEDRKWAEWVEACEGCERVFLVEVDKEELCGQIPTQQEFVMGLSFSGTRGFTMHRVYEQRERLRSYQIAQGQTRNNLFFYDYEGDYGRSGYEVLGYGEIREE